MPALARHLEQVWGGPAPLPSGVPGLCRALRLPPQAVPPLSEVIRTLRNWHSPGKVLTARVIHAELATFVDGLLTLRAAAGAQSWLH